MDQRTHYMQSKHSSQFDEDCVVVSKKRYDGNVDQVGWISSKVLCILDNAAAKNDPNINIDTENQCLRWPKL
jgi:hypothetical protein